MKIGPDRNQIRKGYFFLAGAALSTLFWIIESIVHVMVFHDKSLFNSPGLIDNIFTHEKHELWMRLIIVSAVFILTSYVYSCYRLRKSKELLIAAVKTAEEEKNRAEAIIAGMGDGMIIQDTAYKIIYQNQIQTEKYGNRNGEHCYKVYEGRDKVCEACPVELTFRDGKIHKVERSIATANGTMHFELTSSPLKDAKGEIVAGIKIVRDISNRKKIEETLMKSEERYRTFIDSTMDMSILKDENLRYLIANKACAELFDKDENEIIGKTDHDLMPGYIADICRESDLKALKSDGIHISEETVGDRIYETRKFRVKIGGNTFGVGSYIRDITKQKQVADELITHQTHLEQLVRERTFELQSSNELLTDEVNERKLTEEKYRSLFTNMLNGFAYHKILVDNNGEPTDYVFLEVNKYFESFTGLKKEDIIGKEVTNVIPGIREAEPDLIRLYGAVALTGTASTFELYFEPFQRWYSISAYCPEIGYFVSIFEDITERKSLEKSLIDIEDRERRRIGHDLHDGLGQLLTGLAFKIRGLGRTLEKGHFEGAEEAAELSVLIDEAKEQASYLSRGLSPIEMNEEGLMSALESLSFHTSKLFNIPCTFTYAEPVNIHNETALTQLYRIAQEAVTNAVKYAKSSNIDISLNKDHDRIILTVKDNGIGIPDHAERKGGMGMKIMNHRAGLINASLDIRRDIYGGTIITCTYSTALENKELAPLGGLKSKT